MTKALEKKKDEIVKSLKELHADTSGPAQDNLDAIREVIEEARTLEQMLEMDCEEHE